MGIRAHRGRGGREHWRTNAGPDIAAAGIGAGLGYGAHKAIRAAGGYGKIAGMAGEAGAVLKGMIDALRRAAARVAQSEMI